MASIYIGAQWTFERALLELDRVRSNVGRGADCLDLHKAMLRVAALQSGFRPPGAVNSGQYPQVPACPGGDTVNAGVVLERAAALGGSTGGGTIMGIPLLPLVIIGGLALMGRR